MRRLQRPHTDTRLAFLSLLHHPMQFLRSTPLKTPASHQRLLFDRNREDLLHIPGNARQTQTFARHAGTKRQRQDEQPVRVSNRDSSRLFTLTRHRRLHTPQIPAQKFRERRRARSDRELSRRVE